jgi:hypothetical protein
VNDRRREARVANQPPGFFRFGGTLLAQWNVVPAGEQVLEVPGALAVPKQDQCS